MNNHLASVYSIKLKLTVAQKMDSLGERDSVKGSVIYNTGYLIAGPRLNSTVKLQGPPL